MQRPEPHDLTAGLYDQPLTQHLETHLRQLETALYRLEALDPTTAPDGLARLLFDRIVHALHALPAKDRLEHQISLINRVLTLLDELSPHAGVDAGDHVTSPGQRLLAILEAPEGLAQPVVPPRPEIPLAVSDLLVNGRHSLSLGPEVKRELASADRVDFLCSFIKWSGFRLIERELRDFLTRRPGALRVLTTVYMRATERRALDELVGMGADIRVSYDTDQTRLHAKAWLFHRNTGFSTACIGSSNLSAQAMLDGLEWNVRLSQIDNGPILEKFRAAFDQYWNDGTFRQYDPDEFDKAVRLQARETTRYILQFDVEPRPHQKEMLEELSAEREHGHMRNLVVAATGTGKTVLAALDYKRLRETLDGDRLLFVAHRKEILEQSLTTFQVVLKDPAFGELHVGDDRPVRGDHVFASIQSLARVPLDRIAPDAFDVVIVDEFHHAAAPTYERLLEHLSPQVLLGLTATPERTDGQSILNWFDGRTATELRLWKALDQGLLAPFQYFGVGTGPDLAAVPWSRGRYDVASLSRVYTADHWFATRVIQELQHKVKDITTFRALGFCVDIAHATFMTDQFNRAGIHSAVVTASTASRDRDQALMQLRSGDLRVLFSVDVFNEGVDVPDVDTVIFLRPTESPTVFLQQLGRGLRRAEGKECLTVLDFIGNAHRKFRFDARFRAIVGGTRRTVQREVERGFPSLPSGCAIQLDRESEKAVLDNIRQALGVGYRGLVEDLQGLIASEPGEIDLARFLRESGFELEDVYGGSGRCWTRLRREAGVALAPPGPDADQIEKAFARMLHIDDPLRLRGLLEFVSSRSSAPDADAADPLQRLLFMLLGYVREPLSRMGDAWRALWENPDLRDELVQLLRLLDDAVRIVPRPLRGVDGAELPLFVHATYSLDEVMAGLNVQNKKGGIMRIQAGVYHVEELRTDCCFVTLEKHERDYTPTTMYNDYPISPTRFHWESQSNCHPGTATGKRYVAATPEADGQVVLFVRQRRKDARGVTMPYLCLGRCYYGGHEGERPMRIVWELEEEMPAGFWQEGKVVGG